MNTSIDIQRMMSMAPRVRLGDYIEESDIRCGYRADYHISGIDINKDFIKSAAKIAENSLPKYKVVKPNEFAANMMHVGRDLKIPLAWNNTLIEKLVSPAYFVFHVKENKVEEAMCSYLQLIFSRMEFDRLAAYYCDGSIRGNLGDRFLDIKIPLPSIEAQREIVAVYEGLRKTAEQNEAMVEPLAKACHAYIVDCKEKYPSVRLGDYIEECKDINSDNRYSVKDLMGVTSNGVFEKSKAKTEGLNFSKYKIVYPNYFAYNPSRISLGSIALCSKAPCIISPMYIVFRLKQHNGKRLLRNFINIWFGRREFKRCTLFYAMGSVRDTFDFSLMKEVQIPLPPIEVQQAIVNLYHCSEEAKAIANEARNLMKTICPALVQKAAHSL